MHLKRWLTSIAVLPLVIYLIFKGGLSFFLLIGAVYVISFWEYFDVVFHNKIKNQFITSAGLILGFFMVWAANETACDIMAGLLALNLICCAVISLIMSKPDSPLLETVAIQVQGMIYIPLFLTFLILIRNGTDGMVWIFYLLCIIFSGDIGAYYVGTYFGRHKLIPSVSPGKTIEGSIGGLTANIGIGALINYYLPHFPWGLDMPRLPWGWGILFFLIVGMAGQIGDLFESQLKRAAKIKDSGKILPGHGGLLDRIDALLFAAPTAYFFKLYLL